MVFTWSNTHTVNELKALAKDAGIYFADNKGQNHLIKINGCY